MSVDLGGRRISTDMGNCCVRSCDCSLLLSGLLQSHHGQNQGLETGSVIMSIYAIIGIVGLAIAALFAVGAFCLNAGRKNAEKKASEEMQKYAEKQSKLELDKINSKETMETGSGQSDFDASIALLHHDKAAGN